MLDTPGTIVFAGKWRLRRSASEGILPVGCTEAAWKTKPTGSLKIRIKKYPLATAATWLSLNYNSTPLNSAIQIKTRVLQLLLC